MKKLIKDATSPDPAGTYIGVCARTKKEERKKKREEKGGGEFTRSAYIFRDRYGAAFTQQQQRTYTGIQLPQRLQAGGRGQAKSIPAKVWPGTRFVFQLRRRTGAALWVPRL